jgi:hypothetical protein
MLLRRVGAVVSEASMKEEMTVEVVGPVSKIKVLWRAHLIVYPALALMAVALAVIVRMHL